MTVYAYLFEAKSIQSFILATNRLKEIVGATELVEWLTGTLEKGNRGALLDNVLEALGLERQIEFSRRGGGAFYAFSGNEHAIDALASLWSLTLRQFAPDLEFVHARGEGEDHQSAFQQAHDKLLADRSRLSSRLPSSGPLGRRNRRTGEPATDFARDKKGAEKEPVDAATRRKLDFSRGGRLGRRFAPALDWDVWPLNLSPQEQDIAIGGEEREDRRERDFPFVGDSRYLGVIHADGNGLGDLLKRVQDYTSSRPDDFLGCFSDFSRAVSSATKAAAQQATRSVLEKARKGGAMPARPIVLGGDDLTIVVRADLALPFTREFLTAFATESGGEIRKLKARYPDIKLPDRLTACAGIAYVKSTQPFYLSHSLAEGLCKHAKTHAKSQAKKGDTPSALAFHRITTALVDDYQEILTRELTTPTTHHDTLCHTLEVYGLEPDSGLPLLQDLVTLKELLDRPEYGRGAVRELLGLLHSDPGQAQRRYARWREVLTARDVGGDEDRWCWAPFEEALSRLIVPDPRGDLPFSAVDRGMRRSPLGDINTLKSVGRL